MVESTKPERQPRFQALRESAGGLDSAFADRLRLYLRVTTLINALLSATVIAVALIIGDGKLPPLEERIAIMAGGITGLSALSWLIAARTHPSPSLSIAVASLATLGLTAVYTYGVTSTRHDNPESIAMLSLLVVTILLVFRASIVPSPALATAILGSLCVAFPIYIGRPDAIGNSWMFLSVFWVLCVIVVAVTTVASYTIYGLEERMHWNAQLGPYRLSHTIGSGGMGEVFLAVHAMLGRPTAVKLLRNSTSASARERFQQEVQATSGLTHPNTVDIYDYGRTPEGVLYFAMEYVEGATLETIVQATGPLPAERVIFLLLQAAGSIGEAHSRGLIHRDIKPSNLMLCERGGNFDTLKVLDFGLVRDLSERESGAPEDELLAGTPLYLAPEAILEVDGFSPQSDVYALGATAYFLLAGRPPFEGPTLVDVLSDHLSTEPAPLACGDEALHTLIRDALAKDPKERPADAREFALRLERCGTYRQWKQSDANVWWSEHREVVAARSSSNISKSAAASETSEPGTN